jgi:hypothetical protein
MDKYLELYWVSDGNAFVALMHDLLSIFVNLHCHGGHGGGSFLPSVFASHMEPTPMTCDKFWVRFQNNGVEILLFRLGGCGHCVTRP